MALIAESQTQIPEEEIITQQNVQEKLNKDPGYLSTMAMISETEQSTQNTLDTISETLKRVSAILEGVQKTVNIFGRYEVEFKQAQAHIEKRSGLVLVDTRILKEGDTISVPTVSNIKEATQQIKNDFSKESQQNSSTKSTTKTYSVRSSTNLESASTKIAPKYSSTKSSSLNSRSPTLKKNMKEEVKQKFVVPSFKKVSC